MAQMQAAGGTVAGKNDVFMVYPSANLRLLYDVRILYHRCARFFQQKNWGMLPRWAGGILRPASASRWAVRSRSSFRIHQMPKRDAPCGMPSFAVLEGIASL